MISIIALDAFFTYLHIFSTFNLVYLKYKSVSLSFFKLLFCIIAMATVLIECGVIRDWITYTHYVCVCYNIHIQILWSCIFTINTLYRVKLFHQRQGTLKTI